MCIHKEQLTELDIYHRILRWVNVILVSCTVHQTATPNWSVPHSQIQKLHGRIDEQEPTSVNHLSTDHRWIGVLQPRSTLQHRNDSVPWTVGAVRKQLAFEGGIQTIEQAKRIGAEIVASNLLGGVRQSVAVAAGVSVVVDGVLLQLCRCKNSVLFVRQSVLMDVVFPAN